MQLTEHVGPYRLLEEIGVGGMGEVSLALDPAGRTVALKVLHPAVARDEVSRRRLEREVATMRRVRDPHVAEVLDADFTARRPRRPTQADDPAPRSSTARSRRAAPPGGAAPPGADAYPSAGTPSVGASRAGGGGCGWCRRWWREAWWGWRRGSWGRCGGRGVGRGRRGCDLLLGYPSVTFGVCSLIEDPGPKRVRVFGRL